MSHRIVCVEVERTVTYRRKVYVQVEETAEREADLKKYPKTYEFDAQDGAEKFKGRLREFLQFFTRENAEVINAFGTSNLNSLYFTAEYELLHKRPCLTITHKGKKCQLIFGDNFAGPDVKWPVKS